MYLKLEAFMSGSNRATFLILSLFLVVCTLLSVALIPPFQSPDEYEHVSRAYLLSKGTIVLDTPEGKSSGGMIDSGLSAYVGTYMVCAWPDGRLSANVIDSANSIKWTGIREFREMPGAGYYFPIIYTPQAIGLAIGEKLGFTIDASYRLTRILAFSSVAIILFVAFNIYNVNPLTLALLFMPMSIFQFSSASLDGVPTALSVFSIATFLRIATDKERASPWLFYALAISVALVVTSRTHLLPLLLLVLASCFYSKNNKYYFIFDFSLLAVFVWLTNATKTVVDVRVGHDNVMRIRTGATRSSEILFYIKNPLAFFDVLRTTLSNSNVVDFYYMSFLGDLSSSLALFSRKTYTYFSICISLIGLLSISVKNIRADLMARALLLLGALGSILLVFFLLLVTWNKYPAIVITGIQGRYFLIPMIMFAYAISGGAKLHEGVRRKLALLLLVAFGVFSLTSTTKLLIERYYLVVNEGNVGSMIASPPLDKNNPIKLFMSEYHHDYPKPLKRIGIMFGTYIQKNPGSAELRLTTLDGHTLRIPIDLPDLADNQYKYFDLDSFPYISGEIGFLTGGGISAWEFHARDGLVNTCLIYEYANGKKLYTKGCPRE